MRAFRGLTMLSAIAASAGLLLASGATAASAAPAAPAAPAASVHLRGGHTTVTTGKGIATALLGSSIVPLAAAPGSQWLTTRHGVRAHFGFPVTGGRVSLSPLGGRVEHRGGILFINLKNGKQVKVGRFAINLSHGDLTGIVNGNPKARVPLFWLSLAHAKLKAGHHVVRASGIGLRLTKVAAGALNQALGTHLFAAGLRFGTAATVLRF
jgi:hypothetical protein